MTTANQYLAPRAKHRNFSWSKEIESVVKNNLKGATLHLCSGRSGIGDVRIDRFIWLKHRPYFKKCNMLADASMIPFIDNSFDTIIADPVYDKFEPPFIKEIVRVGKAGCQLIYYYPTIPYDLSLSLKEIVLYPNQGKGYTRILSISEISKLDFVSMRDNDK